MIMNEPIDRFVVRFPRSLRRRVEEVANFYRRSINSEIILRLDHSLNGLPDQDSEHAVEPPMFAAIERSLRSNLSDEEQTLVLSFRRLSGFKRKALLALLG
jgi:Arc-like DNA binding domain